MVAGSTILPGAQQNRVLIPKCSHPTTMKDLWPITLCNVPYKVMAKVLANQLKDILPYIISNAQSEFVPGRSICDNVLVAFEVIQYMKCQMKGKQGIVALTIDISKAYDMINWGYLQAIMRRLGFHSHFIAMTIPIHYLCKRIVRVD